MVKSLQPKNLKRQVINRKMGRVGSVRTRRFSDQLTSRFLFLDMVGSPKVCPPKSRNQTSRYATKPKLVAKCASTCTKHKSVLTSIFGMDGDELLI